MATDTTGGSYKTLERGKVVLGSLSFDRYAELCSILAAKFGMNVSDRELSQDILLLRGTLKEKQCTAVCTLPGVRAGRQRIGGIIKAVEKNGGIAIIFSPAEVAVETLSGGSIRAVVAGDDFTRMASRTSVFRDELLNANAPERISPGTLEEKRRFSDMLRYARERYDAGDFAEASSTVNLLLTIRPGSDELHRLKGNVLLRSGKAADAAAAFSDAVRLGPSNTENLFGKATALYQLGNYRGELECYDQILRLNPSHRASLLNRGVALQQTGRLEEAVKAYLAIISKFGKDSGTLRNLSLAYYNLGNKGDALKALDAILSFDPSDERAIRLKGLLLAEEGRYDALEYLEHYNSIREEADILGVIASIYNKSGRKKEARNYAERALRLEPGNSIAMKEFDAAGEADEGTTVQHTVYPLPEAHTVESDEPADIRVIGEMPDKLKLPPVPDNQMTGREMLDSEQIARMVEEKFRSPEAVYDALILLQAIGTQQATGAIDIVLAGLMQQTGNQPGAGFIKIAEKRAFEKGDFGQSAELCRKITGDGTEREAGFRLLSSLIGRSAFDDTIEAAERLDGEFAADVRTVLFALNGRTGKAARMLSRRDRSVTSVGESNAGALMLMREGPGEAVDYYTSLQNRSSAGAINRAAALYLRGDRALAAELLAGETARMWQHLFDLGYMFLENGKTDEAIAELTRAAALERSADILNVLGVALARAGKNTEAKKRFEEALSVDDGHREARRNLKHIERMLRR